MENENTTLLNKKTEDLTVGDAIKIQLGFFALAAAVPVVIVGGAAVADKVRMWNYKRQLKKLEDEDTTETE